MIIGRFGLPLTPLWAVFRRCRHACMVVWAAAAVVGHDQLREFESAHLRHLVELLAQELEEMSAPLSAACAGETAKDVIQDHVDAVCVWAQRVSVQFHEEKDGGFVLVVSSSVPYPGCELRIDLERHGTFADCQA